LRFGQYLRETRQMHRMPLSQLASCTRISKDTLQDMENHRRMPSYSELQQLAMALRRPEAELLEHAGIVRSLNARPARV
jgi:transcriptional regulator with XRE-family HTH domain